MRGPSVRGLYDLAEKHPTFNFYEWIVQARGKGVTRVVFDISNIRNDSWPDEVTRERFWSICYPGPYLMGMGVEVLDDPFRPPTELPELHINACGKALVDYFRSGARFQRLASFKKPVPCEYTVTIRKCLKGRESTLYRDSNEAVWRDFAQEIGAVVIEDYEVRKIHLHDRMALYAGAKMNFFVSNGPGVLCSMTRYPCMLFNTIHAKETLIKDGIEDGGQYPWMLENQRTVWEEATPESLRRHFYHWRKTGEFAEDGYKPT